ncbi:MAG: rhodanese-like domain-containing protein [Acidobacteria bacterium]|nr:rhodanese-like domain-containing protein [Acidobacteriota bacterium]
MMRKLWWTIPMAALLALAACGGSAPPAEQAEAPAATEHHEAAATEATEMDVAALKQRLDNGEDIFLLDVRNPGELVEHGMIAGAVNIPVDQLEARLAEVPKDKPIVTYCMRGGRASRAAETLREAGYNEPIEFGGITAWKEAGYEVVQPKGE